MKMLQGIIVCGILLFMCAVTFSQDITVENIISVGANLSSLGYPAGWSDPLSHDIKVTPDGKKAYVLSSGYTRNLYVIDLTTRSLLKIIPFSSGVWKMMGISKDGSKLFISTNPPSPITVFSTSTDSVVTTIPLPSFTWCFNFEFSPDGSKMYVMTVPDVYSYWQRSRLLIVDTSTLTITSYIDMDDTSAVIDFRAWKVTPDGKYLLYGSAGSVLGINWQTGFLTAIDLSVNQVVAKIPVTSTSGTWLGANVYGVKYIAVSNGKAYVANYHTGDIAVVDLSTMQAIKRITVGGSVFRISAQARTNYVWALARGTDKVAIVDTTSDTIVVETGLNGVASYIDDSDHTYGTPLLSGIDFTGDGNFAVVTASDSQTVALFDANKSNSTFGTMIKSLSTSGYPTGIKIVGNTVYIVMDSDLLVCDVKGATPTLEEAITEVAASLKQLIANSPKGKKSPLQRTYDDIMGNNGLANNGAIEKLSNGDYVAAIEKVKQAIKELQEASRIGFDTFSLMQTLAFGAGSEANTIIMQAANQVGSNNAYVLAAENLYNTGLSYLQANDFLTAVDYFKKAIAVALDSQGH